MKWQITIPVTFLFVAAIAAGVSAQMADYGDLPDTFPTKPAAGGPYHTDVSHEWIGYVAGGTTLEAAPKQIDMDEDDGAMGIAIEPVFQGGIFQTRGRVYVPVTTDSDPAVRYLNVAADLDNSGNFQTYSTFTGMQYEWVVCNLPILFRNDTKVVTSDFVLLQPLAAPVCMRATLTTVPIAPVDYGANGWDGGGPSGGFGRGETEDVCPPPPVVTYDDDNWEGVFFPPPNEPPQQYDEPNWPTPSRPYIDPPGGGQPPIVKGPDVPLNNPDPPVTTEPPRFDQPDPGPIVVADNPAIYGMPDIKQGKNECVPTATANSISWLMDEAEIEGEGANSDEVNRNLQEKLKTAMGTTAAEGTKISPDKPEECNFLKGKAAADLPQAVKDRLVTKTKTNPSFNDICNAVSEGKDVEIVLGKYTGPNPPAEGAIQGHMVTVVGCVVHPDGTMELKYHDPGDLRKNPPENPGDTVFPPREHSMIVKGGGPDQGGLRAVNLFNEEGERTTFYIEYVFIESLAQEGDLDAKATADPSPTHEGGTVGLEATCDCGGKATGEVCYMWFHNDIELPWATEAVFEIPFLIPEMCGTYKCFVYDSDSDTFDYTNEVTVAIGEAPQTPVTSLAGLAVLSGFFSIMAANGIRRKQR
jgi:hypothetical protein